MSFGPSKGASMPVDMGMLSTVIYGGPYRSKPSEFAGVKMAAEIDLPCAVSVPVQDFGVPDPDTLKAGVTAGLMLLATGQVVYAGCAGGIGRTGLYLAVLAKTCLTFEEDTRDPVAFVRSTYFAGAVETAEQEALIDGIEVDDICQWWSVTQRTLYGERFLVPHLPGVSVRMPTDRPLSQKRWVKDLLTRLS